MRNIKNYGTTTSKPGRPSLLDRMMKAYFNRDEVEDVLTDEDQQILKRWKVVHMLSLQHRPCISTRDIVTTLVRDFGVSEMTAIRDVTNAQKLFGHVNKANKDFKRAIYVEWLEQLASLAEVRGDIKSAVAALDKAQEIMRLSVRDEDEDARRGNRIYQLNMIFNNENGTGKHTVDLSKIQELQPQEFKQLLNSVDRPRVDTGMMKIMLDEHHAIED